jgi:NADH-quinone oxidoreductase subunit C
MSDYSQKLREAFPVAVLSEARFRDETSLTIQLSALREICLYARDTLGFNYLVDVSSIDHFGNEPRFELV